MKTSVLILLMISLSFVHSELYRNFGSGSGSFFNDDYVPYHSIFVLKEKLTSLLSEQGISNIELTSIYNDQLEKYVGFSCLQNDTTPLRGIVHAFYKDGSIQVGNITFLDQKSETDMKEWENYKLSESPDYYDYRCNNFLYHLEGELKEKLYAIDSIFFEFIEIQSQLKSGHISIFKFKFYALNQDEEIVISTGLAHVTHSLCRIEITDLSIKQEPYYYLMKKLRSQLSPLQISDIQYTSSKYSYHSQQVVLKFTYLQKEVCRSGELRVYNPEYSRNFKVLEIKLQNNESDDYTNWINLTNTNYSPNYNDDYNILSY